MSTKYFLLISLAIIGMGITSAIDYDGDDRDAHDLKATQLDSPQEPNDGVSCPRPPGWCSHRGANFQMIDCDGDGIEDPTCSDTTGKFGVIYSTQKCTKVWPNAQCAFKNGVSCPRPGQSPTSPLGWCGHRGATFEMLDCDNDGIADPICSDTTGKFGVVYSTQKCNPVWPKAVCFGKN